MSSTPPAPYSRFREFGDLVAFSGQVGTQDGKLVAGGFLPELHQCLANLSRLLEQAGLTPSDIVKTTVFLADIADWPTLNGPWMEFFAEPRPARTAIAVSGLPFGARVEVEAWAVRPAR
jgi:2-iminobutanoate/2-iminopropanoate deaminase